MYTWRKRKKRFDYLMGFIIFLSFIFSIALTGFFIWAIIKTMSFYGII